jgi:hypothetical protein
LDSSKENNQMKKLLLLYIFLFSSCGLLRRSTKSSSEIHNLQTEDIKQQLSRKINTLDKTASFTDKSDSSKTNYQFRFYPRGVFNIGPDGIIKGEFDSISLSGKSVESSRSKVLTGSQKAQKEHISAIKKESRSNDALEKVAEKKIKSSGKMLAIILAIIGLGLFYLLKKEKKL